jgi:PilZ domain
MSRRYDRSYAWLPVDLVGVSAVGGFEQPGSVVDLSRGGLRVQTSLELTPGQALQVFLKGVSTPYASCRVIWTRRRGGDLPGDAGLAIEEFPAPRAHESGFDFLDDLRRAYRSPALALS